MPSRALIGLLAAGAVAGAAWRTRSLSGSGAVAATLAGAAAVAAGWAWGALLVLYFVSSVLLSRLGAEAKARRTGAIVEKGGRRDALQVVANGGLFAGLALASTATAATDRALIVAAALGALAAAAADTWATEIGTLARGNPRSLRGLRRVAAGTSGAVSLQGTLALVAGALFVALMARLLGLPAAIATVAAGGIAGALTDSVLGATVQHRRWCDACERGTERRVHDCGAETRPSSGLAWIDNDAVNAAATLAGAATAAALQWGAQ